MSFLSRLATRFYRNSWVGVFIILLVLCSNFRYSFINTDPGGDSTLLSLPETFGWGFFIPLLVAFVPDRCRVLRRCLIGFFLFLASLLFFGEQILITGYKTIFTDSIVLNILATNPREAAEFMAGASLVKYLFLPLLLFIASLAIAYVVYRLSRTKKGEISVYWLTAPLVVLLGGSLFSSYLIITSYRNNYPNYKVMTPLSRLVTGVMKCAEEMSSVEETLEALRRVDCGEVHQDPSFAAHSLVLVVGESATRAYHHCYGFPLANTPFLDSLIASKEVILFDNAVAPAPYTAASLSQVLTFFQRTDTLSTWDATPTLPLVLQKAGYYTYWLSNQEKQGLFIQPVAAIASTSDSLYYANVRSSRDWWAQELKLDGDVLPHLLTSKTPSLPKNKIFELVHLMGSHPCCKERYPSNFSRFKPEDLPSPLEDRSQNEAICEYANSILYTDYMLHEIIQRYAQEPSVVVYVADHGILTYDPEAGDMSDVFGHAPHWKSISVPFMVYVSPKMRQLHPELVSRLEAVKHQLFTTDVLPYFLCSLMGIRVEKYPASSQDPLSSKYVAADSVVVTWQDEPIVVRAT